MSQTDSIRPVTNRVERERIEEADEDDLEGAAVVYDRRGSKHMDLIVDFDARNKYLAYLPDAERYAAVDKLRGPYLDDVDSECDVDAQSAYRIESIGHITVESFDCDEDGGHDVSEADVTGWIYDILQSDFPRVDEFEMGTRKFKISGPEVIVTGTWTLE